MVNIIECICEARSKLWVMMKLVLTDSERICITPVNVFFTSFLNCDFVIIFMGFNKLCNVLNVF